MRQFVGGGILEGIHSILVSAYGRNLVMDTLRPYSLFLADIGQRNDLFSQPDPILDVFSSTLSRSILPLISSDLENKLLSDLGLEFPPSYFLNSSDTESEDAAHDLLRTHVLYSFNKLFDPAIDANLKPSLPTAERDDALIKKIENAFIEAFASARIQKVLAELIKVGLLSLKSQKWVIILLEWDSQLGNLAFEEFRKTLQYFLDLEGDGRTVPEIEFHQLAGSDLFKKESLEEKTEKIRNIHFDLLIDLSVVPKKSHPGKLSWINTETAVKIKSKIDIPVELSNLTGEFVNYQLSSFAGEPQEKKKNEAIEKIQQLLFRQSSLNSEQEDLIKQISSKSASAFILPSIKTAWKSALIGTLIQNGISVLVVPFRELVTTYKEELSEVGMNVMEETFLNSNDLSQLGESRVICLSSFSFQNELVQSGLENIVRKTGLPTYFIFSDFHCMSEFGPQFMPSYFQACSIVGAWRNDVSIQERIRITGLSPIASYDVTMDFCNKMNMSFTEDTTQFTRDLPTLEQVKIVALEALDESQLEDEDHSSQEWILEKKSAELRVSTIVKLLEKNTRTFSAQVVCPSSKGALGATEIQQKFRSHTDSISKRNRLQINLADETDQKSVNNNSQKSLKGRDKEPNNIYIRNIESGGLLSDIGESIFLVPPVSIDELYLEFINQPPQKNQSLTILNSNHPTTYHSKNPNINNSIDKSALLDRLNRVFIGQEKEKRIIHDLFRQISMPSELRNKNSITKRVHQDTGTQIRLEMNEDVLEVYDFSSSNLLLSMDLKNLALKTEEESNLNQEIRASTTDYIQKNKGIAVDLSKWIRNHFSKAAQHGLITAAEILNDGEEFTIHFNLKNDHQEIVEQILALMYEGEAMLFKIEIILQNGTAMIISVDKDVFRSIVWEASKMSSSPADFIKTVNNLYKKEIARRDEAKGIFYKNYRTQIQLPIIKAHRQKIDDLLMKIRTPADTFSALHRLLQFKFIDDYSIDYETEACSIICKMKSESDLEANFIKVTEQFISRTKLQERLNAIHASIGEDTHIYDAFIDGAIDFIYEVILPTRHAAVESVFNMCSLKGANATDLIQSHYKFKYTKTVPEFNLDYDLGGMDLSDSDIITKYLDVVANDTAHSYFGNLKQLESSCDLLILKHPERAAPKILKAFTVLYLGTYVSESGLEGYQDKKIVEAAHLLSSGFEILRKTENLDSDQLIEKLDNFKIEMTKQKEESKKLMDQCKDLVILKMHSNWLKSFNAKLLMKHDN